ncbi:MAG TPA: hypothetical protein VG122_15895 [Gemmata sp.]|nr:hypothetical protein [Gemmata sp.]
MEDWIQAVKAKHSGIEGEVECVTRRMFRCTIAYLNDLFSPSFFWDMLVQIQGNISQQIQQQHLSDTDRSWSETQRDKIHEIGRENLRLLKEMVGNPFRPITFNPSWLTSTVLALAKGIYQEKAFDRMPILADALQDAGCNNDDLLNHLRSDGPHVLGCWALDIILGKK